MEQRPDTNNITVNQVTLLSDSDDVSPPQTNLSKQPSSSTPALSSKPSHTASAPRQSPATTTKQSTSRSPNNQPDSDDDEVALDLAKISSYEYEQVAKLNPVQLRRYEQYRRSDLKNAKVRRLILAINPAAKPTDPFIIAIKGLAKLFVGDIVETAIQVKRTLGHRGALQPKHIREAYRRLRRQGAVPFTNQRNNTLH